MDKSAMLTDPRFAGIEPFEKKVWLSSPTMHGEEQEWVDEAIQTNWVSTVGANINEVEKLVAEKVGRKYAVSFHKTELLWNKISRYGQPESPNSSAWSSGVSVRGSHACETGEIH